MGQLRPCRPLVAPGDWNHCLRSCRQGPVPLWRAALQPLSTLALRTGRMWQSPVRLLVHDVQGLWVSFRGALAFKERLDLPALAARPCESCAAPCLTACPVGALTTAGYDVPACHAYLNTDAGQTCMTDGCIVRRTCPVSQGYARIPEQSAYHMRQFHK